MSDILSRIKLLSCIIICLFFISCFSGVSLHHYLEDTDPASNPPECVKRYAQFLKYKYKELSVLPDPDWPPAMATKDHYTNLAIIKRERNIYTGDDEIKARDYAHGRIDKIVGEKTPINLEETFHPIISYKNESRLTILMDGAPGVGKTTITRKLCIDWAKGDILQEYFLVISVSLREIKVNQQGLVDEISILYGNNQALKESVMQYINNFCGANILFIFDGFDELSYEQRKLIGNTLIVKLIKGDTLFRSSVIVTSRPYASKSLRDFQRVNRHVEVLGFTERQISDCVHQNLCEEDGEKLIRNLQERLDIKSLCYIPLNCRIVLFVYKHNRNDLPDTLTQLYEIFILHTIKHFADRISTDPNFLNEVDDAHCYDALPVSVQRQLHSLSEMAFLGMQEDKLVFAPNELRKHDLLSLGLLTSLFVLTNVTEIKHFQFLHLTIQEFLAAKYLSSGHMSNEEVAKFFQNNVYADRFRMTLLFLAGLSKFSFLSQNEILLRKDDPSLNEFLMSKSNILFLLQLLYESRNESSRVLPLFKAKLNMSKYTLSQFDIHVLLHAFSHTPQGYVWEEVNLASSGLSDENISSLLSKNNSNLYALGNVKDLELRQVRDDETNSLQMFIDFLAQSNSLVSVKFSVLQTDSDCSLVSKLCEVLADHPTLVQLSFGKQRTLSRKRLLQTYSKRFPICSHAFVHLARFFDVEQITELHLSGYSQAFKDCTQCGGSGELARKCLCELISKSQKLKSLNLRECHLTEEFMKTVMSLLKHGLKCATVLGNSGSYLTESLQVWSLDEKRPSITLDKRIKLKKNKKSQVKIEIHVAYHPKGSEVESFNQVVKAVEDSTLTLHELSVYLISGLAKPICQVLQSSTTLCTLELRGIDNRAQEDLLQILHVLQGNSTLRELSIPFSYGNDQTAKALSEMIEHNETIHTLTIDPDLIKGNYKTVARALLQNTTLQNLYMSSEVDSLKEAIRQLRVDENVPVHPNWNLKIDYKKRNH